MESKYIRVVGVWAVLVVCAVCSVNSASAADAAIEKEIKSLEDQEVRAVLAHDAATLERLWDKAYVVHNPEGRIVLTGASVMDRPVFQNARASFEREVESIVVNGDMAISMGNEVVVLPTSSAGAGEVIKRRYTNVWMRKDCTWKLVARHANRICGKD